MSPEKDFTADIVIDFDRRLLDDEFFQNGGRLDVVRCPEINESIMGLIDIPKVFPVSVSDNSRKPRLWSIIREN